VASVGNSQRAIINALAAIQAQAEVANVPPPVLAAILDKAREAMTQKPDTPPGPPTP